MWQRYTLTHVYGPRIHIDAAPMDNANVTSIPLYYCVLRSVLWCDELPCCLLCMLLRGSNDQFLLCNGHVYHTGRISMLYCSVLFALQRLVFGMHTWHTVHTVYVLYTHRIHAWTLCIMHVVHNVRVWELRECITMLRVGPRICSMHTTYRPGTYGYCVVLCKEREQHVFVLYVCVVFTCISCITIMWWNAWSIVKHFCRDACAACLEYMTVSSVSRFLLCDRHVMCACTYLSCMTCTVLACAVLYRIVCHVMLRIWHAYTAYSVCYACVAW
jgi:hypothetical protein